MINYAHLKSQMIQLLDLLRSILYPNVFDAMEEAHSKEELEAAARRQLREILERIYREPPQYDDVIDTLFFKLPPSGTRWTPTYRLPMRAIPPPPAGKRSCWPTQPLKPSAFSASPMSCIS